MFPTFIVIQNPNFYIKIEPSNFHYIKTTKIRNQTKVYITHTNLLILRLIRIQEIACQNATQHYIMIQNSTG